MRRAWDTVFSMGVAAACAVAAPAPARAFECSDIRARLNVARDKRDDFDRIGFRELIRERDRVKSALKHEEGGPGALQARNQKLEREAARLRTEARRFADLAANHEQEAQQLTAQGDAKKASRARKQAAEARRKEARRQAQIDQADGEAAANREEIDEIQTRPPTAADLRKQLGELERQLGDEKSFRNSLADDVRFHEWILELCRESSAASG